MRVAGHQSGSIRASCAMNSKTLTCGYKPKYIISGNWFATIGECIDDSIAAFSKDYQFGILFLKRLRSFCFRLRQFWLRLFNPVAEYLEIVQFFKINIS